MSNETARFLAGFGILFLFQMAGIFLYAIIILCVWWDSEIRWRVTVGKLPKRKPNVVISDRELERLARDTENGA